MQKPNKPDALTRVETVIGEACGMSPKSMFRGNRGQEYVSARHAVWYTAYALLGYPLARIARIYGVDHTTVRSAVKKIQADEPTQKTLVDGVLARCPELRTKTASPIDTWKF